MKKTLLAILSLATVFTIGCFCVGCGAPTDNPDKPPVDIGTPDDNKNDPPEDKPGDGEDKPVDTNLFVFEFEDTDFTGKIGAGNSGSAKGTTMIQAANSEDNDIPLESRPSNDHYVSYTYTPLTFDFVITSDQATTTTVILRLNSEFGAVKYDKSAFDIVVNGTSLDYKPMTIYPGMTASNTQDSKYFYDYELSVKADLISGDNTISVQIHENTLKAGGCGAPQLDCMKLMPTNTATKLVFKNKVNGNYSE